MKKTNYEKIFFNKLADKLEELYPKGQIAKGSTRPRSLALVFNAYANVVFREVLEKLLKKAQGK